MEDTVMSSMRLIEAKLAERKTESKHEDRYPDSFYCPVTRKLFTDPAILTTGVSVEKSIAHTLKTCPIIGISLKASFRIQKESKWEAPTKFVINYGLKKLIENYREESVQFEKKLQEKTHTIKMLSKEIDSIKQQRDLTLLEIKKIESEWLELNQKEKTSSTLSWKKIPSDVASMTAIREQKNSERKTESKNIENKEEEEPEYEEWLIKCPIGLAVMKSPFVSSTGHSCEEEELDTWLNQKLSCPLTRTVITDFSVQNSTLIKATKEVIVIFKQHIAILESKQQEINNLNQQIPLAHNQVDEAREELATVRKKIEERKKDYQIKQLINCCQTLSSDFKSLQNENQLLHNRLKELEKINHKVSFWNKKEALSSDDTPEIISTRRCAC